ncbi:hypothetical protein CHUAL_010375 [Chamberlinius hualienensis]
MSSKTVVKCVAIAFCLLLVLNEFARAAPSYDVELIKDLYEMLLRNDPERFNSHQMVRKGGRDPAVRLRFGRRADPYWQQQSSAAAFNSLNNDSAENSTN